jgi:hypothetical protein
MGQDIKELTGILIVIVAIIAAVQWFLVRFTHWSVALIVTVIIAIFISFIYVSLSHASPNGGSGGLKNSELVTSTLIIFSALLCGFAGVCYLTKIQIPQKAIILPIVLIVVFAVGRYIYQYVYDVTTYFRLFSKCEIELIDDTNGKSTILEIGFKDTTSSLVSNIQIDSGETPYPRLTRNASNIIFHRYTDAKGMSRQIFPFDYSLCHEKDSKRLGLLFWLRQKEVLPMKIVLLPKDKVDLYLGGNLVQQYQLNDEEATKKTRSK